MAVTCYLISTTSVFFIVFFIFVWLSFSVILADSSSWMATFFSNSYRSTSKRAHSCTLISDWATRFCRVLAFDSSSVTR